MQRINAASAISMPRAQVPPTARRRRRRNRWRLRLPTAAFKQLFVTSRWISLLLLLLTAAALTLIGLDESFYLTTIPVQGVSSIPPAEIVNASGLGGAHVFGVEPSAAADQITDIPGVISATVTLEWPNQAQVRIEEDTPVAVWEQGDERYWVNAEGELVPARVDLPGLLHIRAEGAGAAAVLTPVSMDGTETAEEAPETETEERTLFVPDEVLRGALQLRELRSNIDLLYYDMSGGLSYQDGRGWRVYFGAGTDMEQKLVLYEQLVEHLLERGVQPVYISVADQETPFYLAGNNNS
ncbi:MAG: FtsQ-type POTRA domain-containing protein [Candidatus Promineifilaceae bacterium]|nr:FtsQ-type POTRA domain-containing protein [Candidatus Promineifilaceae bacterium]